MAFLLCLYPSLVEEKSHPSLFLLMDGRLFIGKGKFQHDTSDFFGVEERMVISEVKITTLYSNPKKPEEGIEITRSSLPFNLIGRY